MLVAQLCLTLCNSLDCSPPGFPSPGDLPDPGIKPGCPALQVDSLLSELPGKPTLKREGKCMGDRLVPIYNVVLVSGVQQSDLIIYI